MKPIKGTLGKDPELKYSSGGKAYAKLSVAFTPYKKDVPARERPSQWFNVVVFGNQAENVAESLQKGDRVIVDGELQVEEWQDKKTGENRTGLSIIADFVAPSLEYASVTVQKVKRENPNRGYDLGEEPF